MYLTVTGSVCRFERLLCRSGVIVRWGRLSRSVGRTGPLGAGCGVRRVYGAFGYAHGHARTGTRARARTQARNMRDMVLHTQYWANMRDTQLHTQLFGGLFSDCCWLIMGCRFCFWMIGVL